MLVAFLYNELPRRMEGEGGQFMGALSVDAQLDSIMNGIARYDPSITICLFERSNLSRLYRYNGQTIENFDFQGRDVRFDCLFVSPYALHSLDETLQKYITVKTVLSFPAVWWYEHPDIFPYSLFEKNIKNLRRINTCYIAPNARITDYLVRLALLHGGVDISERVFTAPYFVPALQDRRPDPQEKIIIDSGGPWRWTANHVFAEAFVEYCNKNPSTKLRFVFSLKDKSNNDHNDYQQQIVDIYSKLDDPTKVRMIQWPEKDLLKKYLSSAHYGLSVSINTVESYLSSRVRLRDYIAYKLPVITTTESLFYEENKNISIPVEPSRESFTALFNTLENAAPPDLTEAYDTEKYNARYAKHIKELMEGIVNAPVGGGNPVKSDIKIDCNDLDKILSIKSAVVAFRRLAYQLPAEALLFYLKELLGDANTRNTLKSDRQMAMQFLDLASEVLVDELNVAPSGPAYEALSKNALIDLLVKRRMKIPGGCLSVRSWAEKIRLKIHKMTGDKAAKT